MKKKHKEGKVKLKNILKTCKKEKEKKEYFRCFSDSEYKKIFIFFWNEESLFQNMLLYLCEM